MAEDKKIFLEYSVPSNGWRATPLSLEKEKVHLAHVAKMAKEVKAELKGYKKPVSTQQTPYVERLMAMTEDELIEHRNRKIDKEKAQVWKTEHDAQKAIEKAEQDKVHSKDGYIAEGLRHQPKNDQGSAWSEGESPVYKWLMGENKDKAEDAYLKTKAELRPIEVAMIQTADPKHLNHKDAKPIKPRPLWRRILDGRWLFKDDTDDLWRSRK